MPPIDSVANHFSMGGEPLDIAYWRTRTVEERLQAVVDLRREVEGWTEESEPRLARVAQVRRMNRDLR